MLLLWNSMPSTMSPPHTSTDTGGAQSQINCVALEKVACTCTTSSHFWQLSRAITFSRRALQFFL